MSVLDIIIIIIYFIASLAIALRVSKRSAASTENFFLTGRMMPWWLAGTTMVATTFAADTPLAVTELVVTRGIAGNWLWWNMVAGSLLTVFFFAKLWRRAEILTDIEFIEKRYSGKSAAFLRGFKAVYLGIFMNTIIMGWVNVALVEILKVIFGIDETSVIYYVIGSMAIVGIYSAISGLWGVAYTDMFQFVFAMTGCVALAVIALGLPEVGGIDGLKRALPESTFHFLPNIGGGGASGAMAMTLSAFSAYTLIQWWSSWYPGAEPGGGGYVAQRIMSAKDERHSMLASFWFSIAHYTLRPWPWIIVALAAMVLYPNLGSNPKAAYIYVMRDHLPSGLLGLLVAAFFAAYMSTMSSQLNWGSSYIIHDLYKRFIKKTAAEKHYVFASRVVAIILVSVSSCLVFFMNSISGAWAFLIECSAGLGLVLILRWYWWRINAWSEITAMITPLLVYGVPIIIHHATESGPYKPFIKFPESLFFTASITTIAWIIATFISSPVDRAKLASFYRQARPAGPGWNKIIKEEKISERSDESIPDLLINWVLAMGLVYSSLFGIGKVIFKEYATGAILIIASIVFFIALGMRLKK
jgi:Na+/proline symporter